MGSIPTDSTMMCLKTFTVKSKDSFGSWQEWVNFVNQNYIYGITESKVYDWKDNCKVSEIPSYHPYWTMIVCEKLKETLEWTKDKYKKCLKDYNNIKFYFNSNTKITDIEDKIKSYKNKIESYEKRLKY